VLFDYCIDFGFYEREENMTRRESVCLKLQSPTEFLKMKIDRNKTSNGFDVK